MGLKRQGFIPISRDESLEVEPTGWLPHGRKALGFSSPPLGPAVTREQSTAFLRNSNGRLDLPVPTQEAS